MSNKIKIIADNKIPYLKGALEPFADMVYLPGADIKREDVKDADALIIRTRTKCNAQLLEGSSVKYIATATIGFDHIDREYCAENDIQWTNAPGCNSSSVQQYVATVLLHLAVKYEISLRDKIIGIIGVGNVGKKIKALAESLGMTALLNDPPRARAEGDEQFVTLEKVIQESDFITLHVPLNQNEPDKTYHLLDEKTLSWIKEDAFLINTSRGPVVDNQALKQILGYRLIHGAVLDVWENEPDIDEALLNLLEIGTPHIAGYSRDGKANGTAMSVQKISRFFDLGIDAWYPSEIETPGNTDVAIMAENKSYEQIIHQAVKLTYDITYDDQKLRKDIGGFEKQRGDYPVRREFNHYKITIPDGDPFVSKALNDMGFGVVQ